MTYNIGRPAFGKKTKKKKGETLHQRHVFFSFLYYLLRGNPAVGCGGGVLVGGFGGAASRDPFHGFSTMLDEGGGGNWS